MTKTKHKNCILTCSDCKGCLDCGCECITFNPNKLQQITTSEEARQYAIDWQQWASEQDLSMQELVEFSTILMNLADRFDLHNEFQENGILV